MAHVHSIYDTDPHFVIDPKTRKIKNDSGKVILIQGDHNSERFTFEIPRYVDGHDMSLCDAVEIHYDNAGSTDEEMYSDVVDVSDLQVSPASDDVVIFSWLISGNATQYKGTLSFAISFQCHDGEGNIEYELGTLDSDDITIGGRRRNSKNVIERVADILSKWRNDLFGIGKTEEANMRAVSQAEQAAIAAKGADVLATIPADYSAVSAMAEEAVRTKADGIVLSAEGECVAINDSSDDYIRGLRVFGKSTQKSTTGKNLFKTDFAPGHAETVKGVTFTVNADGSIHVKGTPNAAIAYNIFEGEVLPTGDYFVSGAPSTSSQKFRLQVNLNVGGTEQTGGVDMGSGSKLSVNESVSSLRGYIYVAADAGAVDGTFYPQLELGAVATDYEPYTGGKASPNPEYPQEIVSVENPTVDIHGKNLLNVNEHFAFDDVVGINVNLPAGEYILSFENESHSGAENPEFRFYDNKIWKTIVTTVKSQTVTLAKPETKIYIYSNGTSSTASKGVSASIEKLMLSKIDSVYEQHKSVKTLVLNHTLPAIPVTSGGNYTDENGQQWISDEVDFERGVYVQRINCATFNGSENWGLYDFQSTYSGFSLHNALDEEHSRSPGMSNQFHNFKQSVNDGIWVGVGNMSMYVISKEWYSKGLDAWKTHLRENPLVVYYPRITPIETPLSESELAVFRALKTNKLTTTVLNDAGAHMQLDYVADTKTYIDNQIAKRIAEITNT